MEEEQKKQIIGKMASIISVLSNKIYHDLDLEPCVIFPSEFEGLLNALTVIDYLLKDIRDIIENEINKRKT